MKGTKKKVKCNFGQSVSDGNTPPKIEEVLNCVVSDACLYDECSDIDDYARNYCEGMKISEINKSWKKLKKIRDDVWDFLGEELFEKIAYSGEVERL